MSKLTKIYGLALVAIGGFLTVNTASAAPSSTPEEVLDAAVGGTINAGVDIFTYVIENYLKYLLVLGVAIGLYVAFKKFAHIGSR